MGRRIGMQRRRAYGMRAFGLPDAPPPTTLRDPWLWPFPSDWWGNIGIGSGAQLVSSGLAGVTITQTQVKTDGISISVDPLSPLKTLTKTDWYYRGDGTQITGVGGADFSAQVRVAPTLYEDGRMNGICCFRDSNNKLWEVQPLLLDQASSDPLMQSPRAAFSATRGVDVSLAPIGGQHGGPNLTAFGLTIRSWELDGTANPIGHTLGINLPPAAAYRFGADNNLGYRWPATNADNGWDQGPNGRVLGQAATNNTYTGTTAAMKLGALLTVDPGYTDARIAAGTLTDPTAIKMTRTIELRGMVFVDVTGTSSVIQFSIEKAAEPSFLALPSKFSSELRQTVLDAKVVNNNTAATPGGGGIPRVPTLPGLALAA